MKLTEFKRGAQLYDKLPELTGTGFAGNAFKIAPQSEVAMTKVAVANRVGHGSPSHQNWVKELSGRLLQRRGEFLHYKRARAVGNTLGDGGGSFSLERLERFATEL